MTAADDTPRRPTSPRLPGAGNATIIRLARVVSRQLNLCATIQATLIYTWLFHNVV